MLRILHLIRRLRRHLPLKGKAIDLLCQLVKIVVFVRNIATVGVLDGRNITRIVVAVATLIYLQSPLIVRLRRDFEYAYETEHNRFLHFLQLAFAQLSF